MFPEFNVKRSGTVIAADTYEKQQETEFLIVEMYTTDLIGRTQIKFTCPVYMERIENEFA